MAKISPKNIAKAVYDATEGKSGQDLAFTLKRSVVMLHKKRMLGKADEILNALQDIFDKKTGTVRMKVTTAKGIGYGEKNRLEHEVKERFKAQHVKSEFFEDQELLGGMRIEVGDEVLDTTYKNKLHQLERFLIQGK
ncbi:hypothetical protein A3A05_02535 [Candidatus Nomurabacteria bacterium RIFCSPLOWO2_01_FULL_41_12]|uniref:ATP synthase subunit delta n=1 Tax=Candidatus Nomurabacteria bacterium RIFCSPLOWO2_01_FULL_41_12 TaxID=1801774 RepID=A0A1F6WVT0_9BACT|nr:MAG: hypothetical protein A2732_00650 [Candidatus Nomurabacteria bacterium RIFCSPHIGHO2_01_FULL_40_10]OGI85968.1 MAG: hypothetical protein A3A05_02535 [Candidatus Nomurabacteria bacterium RIFCSPLOWO2_01_FULL_41_12]